LVLGSGCPFRGLRGETGARPSQVGRPPGGWRLARSERFLTEVRKIVPASAGWARWPSPTPPVAPFGSVLDASSSETLSSFVRSGGQGDLAVAVPSDSSPGVHRCPLRQSCLLRPLCPRVRRSASAYPGLPDPGCSVLAVPPGFDGFLRNGPHRKQRGPWHSAGLLHPAAGHGVRHVSGLSFRPAPPDPKITLNTSTRGPFPMAYHPSKRSPPR